MEYHLGLNSEEELNNDIIKRFESVGMIRGENLCINKLSYFMDDNYCEYLTKYLKFIAKTFEGKDVYYRTADLVPHQINLLNGCDFKLNENNYLMDYRGVRRNLKFQDAYFKEIDAFLNAYSENKNLALLIPFVSTVEEIKKVKEILKEKNYTGKLGVMLEIPSLLLQLDELVDLGIDNFTIGINDLTSFVLGSSREINTYCINDYAIYRILEYTTKKLHSLGKKVTLAGYLNQDIIEFAKKIGIDAINIHYNDIPLIFPTEPKEEYQKTYKRIRERYKEHKNGSKN